MITGTTNVLVFFLYQRCFCSLSTLAVVALLSSIDLRQRNDFIIFWRKTLIGSNPPARTEQNFSFFIFCRQKSSNPSLYSNVFLALPSSSTVEVLASFEVYMKTFHFFNLLSPCRCNQMQIKPGRFLMLLLRSHKYLLTSSSLSFTSSHCFV